MIVFACLLFLFVGIIVGWIARDLVSVPRELGGFGETPAGHALTAAEWTRYAVDNARPEAPPPAEFTPDVSR